MKTIFISTLFPKKLYDEAFMKSRKNMSDAADAFQWHIHDGICSNLNKNVNIINILPVGSFPQYYKDVFVKKNFFCSKFGDGNINVGFCNIKLIRKFFQTNALYFQLKSEFAKVNKGTIIVYSLSSVFIDAVSRLKEKKPEIKVCVIVADLPNMINLSNNSGIIKKHYINRLANKSFGKMSCVDCFVLLTKQMASYLKITKPYCVVEGISTEECDYGVKTTDDSDNVKRVMYSGTLHKRFGVLNLVDAFKKIKDDNYELIICGTGDSETIIKNSALKDNRIVFLGQIPRKEVLYYQKKVTVLINPRQNMEEFTKYSFPSKTLEYLSSGTPVIAYKLDGIPDEYDDYLNYVEDNSIISLKNKIVEVCSKSKEELKIIGNAGKAFALNKKNAKEQTKKILKMLNEIEKNDENIMDL